MTYEYEYHVEIAGCDWIEDALDGSGYWDDEHETVETVVFDTLAEANAFVRSITTEQVVAWEKESRCNALDVVIYQERVIDNVYDLAWIIMGEAEWIGSNINSIWLDEEE